MKRYLGSTVYHLSGLPHRNIPSQRGSSKSCPFRAPSIFLEKLLSLFVMDICGTGSRNFICSFLLSAFPRGIAIYFYYNSIVWCFICTQLHIISFFFYIHSKSISVPVRFSRSCTFLTGLSPKLNFSRFFKFSNGSTSSIRFPSSFNTLSLQSLLSADIFFI